MSRLHRLLRLRPGEGRTVALAVGVSFVAAAGLMIGQSGIEALFFSRYGVGRLPVMYLLLGATMFVASLGVATLIGSRGRGRACLLIPTGIALVAIVGRLGLARDVGWTYPGLWLLQGAAQFLLGLAVWGLAGIVTDTRQAKRFFPLIGGGGVLGQVLGGLATTPLASSIGSENLVLVWIGTLVVMIALGRTLVASGEAHRRDPRVDALDQLRQGFRYVRRSALMRWLALGAVLFSLLFFSLYLPFSRAATERYPDPDELAGFFGVFYALSTGAAFLLSLFVSGRLLARFGVPTVMLVLPAVYVVAFGVLTVQAAFVALLVFRFAQVAWMQGGAISAWEAAINTVPPGRRDQTRAFLYGGPTQIGTVIAGVIALVGAQALSPTILYGVGAGCAVLATVAMLGVRREYARELVQALREGRPNVFGAAPVGEEPFGLARGDSSAVGVAVDALGDADPHVRRLAVHILGDLGTSDAAAALARALEDEDAGVRAGAIEALAPLGGPMSAIVARLTDTDAVVRLAALRAFVALDAAAGSELRALLRDPAADVRAAASGAILATGPDLEAEGTLTQLAGAEQDEVRAAALRAVRGVHEPVTLELATAGLADPAPPVRAEAVRTLAAIDAAGSLAALVGRLSDESVLVREAVAGALGVVGAPAVEPVLASLASPERRLGALAALEHLPLDGKEPEIRAFALETVAGALESYRLARSLDARAGEPARLLTDSLLAGADRDAVIGLRAAALLGDRSTMTTALESVSVSDPAQRANAIEVIESVGDREIVRPLIAMWEAAPTKGHGDDPLELLRNHPDRWIRTCADLTAGADAGAEAGEDDGGTMTETLATLPVMERVLVLRRVPLFAELAPHDLEPIATVAEEHTFDDGEPIARQGDPGDAMFIIVSGEVVVRRDEDASVVARRSKGDVIGEMALITSRPRMAGLVAEGPVRVLSLSRRHFESILRERPETSLGVMRVLCHRLEERGGSAMS